MDFTPTDTQTAVRAVAVDALDRGDASWKALAQADLLGLCVPEEHGGEGLGLLEAAAVVHEAGRRAVSLPLWETLLGAVPTLSRHGDEQQRARILPKVVTGEAVLAVALAEVGQALPDVPRTRLRREGGRLLLSGRKVGVGHVREASVVLVPACLDGEVVVVLLDPASPGVTALPSGASRGQDAEATLVLDDVEVADGDLMAGEAARTLRRHAVAGLCLFGDGLVAGARDLTAAYVASRRQFGRALAEFQTVSGQMAEVYIASRTIGLAAAAAAWRLADPEAMGPDPDDDLAVAAYWLSVEGPTALHTCHHLHGGVGVDVTYPLHTHFAWVKDVVRALGGSHQTQEALASRESVRCPG